jgi:hypothetical protein
LTRFQTSALFVAALLFAGGMYLRFGYELPLPPHPPRPSGPDLAAFRALDFTENIYRASLEKDAVELGLPPPTDELTRLFPYDLLEPAQRVVAGGPPLETRDLSITARVGRVGTSDALILRIENRTDVYVAYRVDTRTPIDPHACMEKAELFHNAIALPPHNVVERTECQRRGVDAVTVERVETMILPPLAFYYVSRLFPQHIGLDARATRGHRVPAGAVCGDIPEQAIRRGMEKGEVSWRDVIDFYARHSCQRYIFPVGYHAFTRNSERLLPAASAASGKAP